MTGLDLYDDDAGPPDRSGETEAGGPAVSKRSRGLALGLGVMGGMFGLHRFYVGKPRTGVAMICTLGGLGIWWLYDVVLLAAGEFRDAHELPLRHWGVEESAGPGRIARGRADRRVEELENEVDDLRQQFNDLAERVDFAERMLAQQREPPRLPRG
jgi:hypothetical protein